MEKIIIGADHAGYRLKERIVHHLRNKGLDVEDIGCYSEDSVDYPNIGKKLAEAFLKAAQENPEQEVRGVLCCGSGIGICISANRFPWIRAVVAHDHNTAALSRMHNNANVICMGGRVIAPDLAFEILDHWLATPFDGGRHQKRVDMMNNMHVEKNIVDTEEAPSC
jgi:ribose 5-phosphate isomerase B